MADIVWERGWGAWDDLRLTNKIEVTWGMPMTQIGGHVGDVSQVADIFQIH